MLQRFLLIGVGGFFGAIARYQIGAIAAERFGIRFPVGTLVINISACFLIGFSVEFLNRHTRINEAWRFLVPIGFIGAYSTFSTFEWEVLRDFTSGVFWLGLLYMIVSLVGGLIAVAIGAATARSLA